MNLSYFRKSNFDLETTFKRLKEEIKKQNLSILGEFSLKNHQGKGVNICQPEWFDKVIETHKELIGLLPCVIVVLKKDEEVIVGVGNISFFGKLTENKEIIELAERLDKTLRSIVENSCGVGPLKVRKIKLYATLSCPYCQMEASWLESNKVKYEHVYVDLNPQAAQEMVEKTGQMGVPVTEIIYDNDEKEYIIGFDKMRLSQILNIKN